MIPIEEILPFLPHKLMCRANGGAIKQVAYFGWDKMSVVSFDALSINNYHQPIVRSLWDFDTDELFAEINMCEAYYEYIDSWNRNLKPIHELVLQMPYEMLLVLFRKHYDVFGWIDKGLAVDIKTVKQ